MMLMLRTDGRSGVFMVVVFLGSGNSYTCRKSARRGRTAARNKLPSRRVCAHGMPRRKMMAACRVGCMRQGDYQYTANIDRVENTGIKSLQLVGMAGERPDPSLGSFS
jgi:hypothetical protein